MIFVILLRYTFQSDSHRVVGIDNTSIFGLAFPNTGAGFTAAIYWCFKRHCCWHRNFQLSTIFFHGMFELFIIWFNEEDAHVNCLALLSLGFSIAHFLLCFSFSLHLTYASTYLAILCQVFKSFVSSLISPGPRQVA